MPIRKEMLARYPKDWPEISRRIRERDSNKCKWCGVANGIIVVRGEGQFAGTFMTEYGDVFDAETGERVGSARGSEYPGRAVRIVLTVAHIHDHSPENCDDDNLAALCQRCHNRHDQPHRIAGRKQRERAKLAVAELVP